MPYFITFILCGFGITFRKSSFIYYILLLWMWILFGWNTDNADFANYSFTYYNILASLSESSYELGYFFLIRQANMLGLSYEDFIKILSLAGLLLMSSTIRKYAKYPSYVLVLYILSTFFVNIVQMRSFFASAIVIFAIRFLVNRSTRNTIIYVLLTLLASTIHFSTVFYLGFAVIAFVSTRKLIYSVTAFSLLGYFIVSGGVVQIIISMLTSSGKAASWISNTFLSSYLVFGLFQVFTLYLVYAYYKYYRKSRDINNTESITKQDEQEAGYMDTMYIINWLLLASTIFYLLGGVFTRIYTNLLPLNLILFSIVLTRQYNGRRRLNIGTMAMSILYALMVFAFTVLPYTEGTVIAIMNNNSFLNGLF